MKRILIIGGGSIGERHLRCFLATGRVQVSLCDTNESLCMNIAGRYAVSQTYVAFDKALMDPFDAAVICTPAHLHIPMALALAKRQIPMLIEKPLSISHEGLNELLATVEQHQLPVSVAYVLRHHPALQALRKCINGGSLGRLVQIVATSGQHFPFYRPAYRQIYYTRHETGGGAIQDALTHLVNATEWIVGPITRLVADADHCVLDGVDVEDTVHLVTRHASIMGAFSLNQHQSPNETTLTFVCENGAARYEAHRNRWLTCREVNADWTVEEEFPLERDDLFVRQASAFLDQLDGTAEAACPISEAAQTLNVNLAALQSVKSGQWVTISAP